MRMPGWTDSLPPAPNGCGSPPRSRAGATAGSASRLTSAPTTSAFWYARLRDDKPITPRLVEQARAEFDATVARIPEIEDGKIASAIRTTEIAWELEKLQDTGGRSADHHGQELCRAGTARINRNSAEFKRTGGSIYMARTLPDAQHFALPDGGKVLDDGLRGL